MSVFEILGNSFYSNNGEVNDSSLKSAKFIGIYFSAHWCPPCRGFTPVLSDVYKKINENEKVFEVVFVSCDSDENEFKNYLSTMPWIAVKFGDESSEKLSNLYKVSGIPRLVIINQNGEIIEENARSSVTSKKEDVLNSWLKGPFKSKLTLGQKVSYR